MDTTYDGPATIEPANGPTVDVHLHVRAERADLALTQTEASWNATATVERPATLKPLERQAVTVRLPDGRHATLTIGRVNVGETGEHVNLGGGYGDPPL